MVEWKKIGEVCEVLRGKRLTKSQLNETEGYPVLHGGSLPMGYYSDYNRKANTTVVVNTGNAGCVFFYDKKFWSSDACFSLYPNEKILDKFLYLYVYGCERILKGKIRAGAMPTIDANAVESLLIPIPSLSEQQHIVSILDTFTSSITNLKKQIEERKKQYEYERDRLLDLEGEEGVEMKKLGEVGEFIRGTGIQKADFVDEGYPCIHYGQIHTKYGLSATHALSFINENLYRKSKKAVKGDVILATTSEDAEGVAKPVAWLGDENVAVSGDAFIYHHQQNGKFIAHLFFTHRFLLFKIKNATGTKVVRISGESMAKFEVALPTLSTQSHIVSILDTFEASIRNLEEQLALREKQYEYYRNQLLTFD